MTNADRPKFSTLLLAIAEIHDRKISDPVVELYFAALKGLSLEQFQQACSRAVDSLKFFPKPAELLELAGAKQPSLEDRALLAWTEAWAAASSVGQYQSVLFTDPVTCEVIRALGGWPRFCCPDVDGQEEKWHRKLFLDTYRAMDSQRERLPSRRLAGIHEIENGHRGYLKWVPKPIQIGTSPRPVLVEASDNSEADVLDRLRQAQEGP